MARIKKFSNSYSEGSCMWETTPVMHISGIFLWGQKLKCYYITLCWKFLMRLIAEQYHKNYEIAGRARLECQQSRWGILVKLVTCVFSGHPKINIANFMKYITFARFLPLNTILWLKNIFGNLIAQLTNILWPINENWCPGNTWKKCIACLTTKKYFFCKEKV